MNSKCCKQLDIELEKLEKLIKRVKKINLEASNMALKLDVFDIEEATSHMISDLERLKNEK